MIRIRAGKIEGLCAGALALLLSAGAGRLLALDFVDLRYQAVASHPLSLRCIVLAFALLFLCFIRELEGMRERHPEEIERIFALFRANMPLLFWLPAWFVSPGFGGVALLIACGAWAAGRSAAQMRFVLPVISGKQGTLAIVLIALCAALAGAAMQISSLHKMAMQWLDWGHFFESLTNTLDGRFFYLNLGGGCYLASRFCPSLLVLLPVAAFRSPELFLFSGALLVASGAVLVYFAARALRFPPFGSLLLGIAFLLLPLSTNLLLPLLDGFHESFLLVPTVFGVWLCCRKKCFRSAAVLILFSFGIRETVGFMWAGWGVFLLLQKKRVPGALLFLFSLAVLVALLGFIMPAFSSVGGYEHTVFFPHLGHSIREIALSPFLRPEAFWGTLFSRHTLWFWVTLLLPFVWGVWRTALFLLPMLPDLLMVSLDSRFDSQNLLRHYQIVPLLVLVIASVETLAAWRDDPPSGRAGRAASLLFGGGDLFAGAAGAMAAGTLLSFWCFTQIPGFPASDPRMGAWSDAGEVIASLKESIPAGSKITAGPRAASHFVCRNDVFLWRGVETEALQDYVVIESFHPMYGENLLRRKLLASPGWVLEKSLLLDERLIQLFRRSPGAPAPVSLLPVSMEKMEEAEWEKWGSAIPSAIPSLSLRGNAGTDRKLLIRARVAGPLSGDIAFFVTLTGEKETMTFFQPFGDGRIPAGLAGQGSVFQFEVPCDDSRFSRCRVDLIQLP